MRRLRQILTTLTLLAGAAFSATLPYQGLAVDAKGNPKADGSGTASFALYSSATGGTALWSESQTIVTVKGLFSVSLGSVTSIPEALFDGAPLYLGVTVNGGSEAGLRLPLGPVPSSIVAMCADSARAAKVADSVRSALHVDVAGATLGVARMDSLAAQIKADSVSLKIARDSVQTLTNLLSGLQGSLFPSNGIPWNAAVPYGTLVDSRDGQLYRTVTIGTQTWMAQNLNYAGSGMCYDDNADNCAKYGRLYTWDQAQQGICPTGWHVPSDAEWSDTTLTAATGAQLMSTSSWPTKTGTDTYGFRALPGGFYSSNGMFYLNLGNEAEFWSSSEGPSITGMLDGTWCTYRNGLMRILSANGMPLTRETSNKRCACSVRCLKDSP